MCYVYFNDKYQISPFCPSTDPSLHNLYIEMLTNIAGVLETNNHSIGITKNVQRIFPTYLEA